MDDMHSTVAASDYHTAAESPTLSSRNNSPPVFQTPLGGWNDAFEDSDSTPRVRTPVSDRLQTLQNPESFYTIGEQTILERYIDLFNGGHSTPPEAREEMPMAWEDKQQAILSNGSLALNTSPAVQAPSLKRKLLDDESEEGGVPLRAAPADLTQTDSPQEAAASKKKRKRIRRGRNHSRLNTPPPGKERDPDHPRRKRKRKRPGKPRQKLDQHRLARTEQGTQKPSENTAFSKATTPSGS